MAATTDGGRAFSGAMPRRRRNRFDLLAGILRTFCQCGGAKGEAACAVCRIPLAAFARAFGVHFRPRGPRAERAGVRDLGNRAAAGFIAATFREMFGIAARKKLEVTWLARTAGVSRQTIFTWKAGKGMAGPIARRQAQRLLDAVRRAPLPAPIVEPPPPPPPPTPEERFWSRVRKTPTCWEWTGNASRSSYGAMNWKGRREYVRRVSLAIAGVPVPEGLWVVHACRNTACVRPDHLAVVTPQEAVRKYRRARKPGGRARTRGGRARKRSGKARKSDVRARTPGGKPRRSAGKSR